MNRHNWRIIKTNEDHSVAIKRLLELASGDLQPGTDEFDEFELLGLLIEHYEKSAFHMDKPDPIEAIKFRMDQQGLTQQDMRSFLGSASKVSEVLNGKRPLSLTMIKRIHDGLGIPLDVLIQDTSALEWNQVPVVRESFDVKVEFQNISKAMFSDTWDSQPVSTTSDLAFTEEFCIQSNHSKGGGFIKIGSKLATSFLTQIATGVANEELKEQWVTV